MNNLTAARDISGIAPIGVLRGISPLCVPYVPGAGIADEVRHRADPRIVSLWERLGLVYLFDQPAAAPVNRTHVTVNNFTAELAFRICSQNHTDRLIERYQPGFVFPENIQSAGRSYETIVRRTELRQVGELFGRNSRYTEEVSRIFRLVFEKETGGIPLQTVCRALAALLGSTGGGAVFTSQQQMIFQRIAKVLSDEYPESTAAQEVASVGAAAVFTEEQRRRILSAANVMGYRSQHDAAQRVLSLVNSGRTREEIGRVLLTEVRRYGLEENAAENLRAAGKIAPFSAELSESTPEGRPAVGVAVPEINRLREVTRLIFAEESHADAPEREVTAAEISESSAARLISERLSSVVERSAGFREISGQLTRLVERLGGNSGEERTDHGSTVVRKFSGAPVTNFISVTAGTSGRLLKQFGGSGQGQFQVLQTPEQTPHEFAENVRNTLNIMQQFSAGNSVEMSYPATEFDFTENTTVPVNVQTGSEVRAVSPERGSGSQLTVQPEKFNNSEIIVEKSNDIEVHSGTVVQEEQPAELRSAEQFHTETVREPYGGNAPQVAEKPGRVVPGESSVELRSAEQFHTETVREPYGGNAPQAAEKPGRVVPGESSVELRSAEQFHTETVREPYGVNAPQAAEKPGRVVPGESSVELRSAEQFHTETVRERTDEQAAGSYRSRLDKKTLETLDRLVAESRLQTVKPVEVREEPVPLVHSESVTAETPAEPVNINADSLRNVSIVRRSIVNETSLHMKKLMEKAAVTAPVQSAVKKAFTYRPADRTGDMVMLIPPAEADRFRASGAFDRKLPPIELRQPPEPQPERESTTRKTTINNRPVIRTSEIGIGELSRDDITKLADKVYEQIETRLTRERRRMGL